MLAQLNEVASRYELRYFIPAELASRIRDFVWEYMHVDHYGVGHPNYAYPVHTIYLDSDDWKIYWKTVSGDQTRLKLRVRYYSDSPEAPVFLEVKRQRTDEIQKQRCGVRREAVEAVLAGFLPEPEQMCSKNPGDRMAVEHFVDLLAETGAKPKLHVACLREGYVADERSVRVTLDSQVRVAQVSEKLLTTRLGVPVATLEKVLILELRFTECFPGWFRELVDTFSLSRPFPVRSNQPVRLLPGLEVAPDDLIYNVVL